MHRYRYNHTLYNTLHFSKKKKIQCKHGKKLYNIHKIHYISTQETIQNKKSKQLS